MKDKMKILGTLTLCNQVTYFIIFKNTTTNLSIKKMLCYSIKGINVSQEMMHKYSILCF